MNKRYKLCYIVTNLAPMRQALFFDESNVVSSTTDESLSEGVVSSSSESVNSYIFVLKLIGNWHYWLYSALCLFSRIRALLIFWYLSPELLLTLNISRWLFLAFLFLSLMILLGEASPLVILGLIPPFGKFKTVSFLQWNVFLTGGNVIDTRPGAILL